MTATDLFNIRVELGRKINEQEITNERVLAHIIKEDKYGTRKAEMLEGVNYYKNENVIKNRKLTYIDDGVKREDLLSTNIKLPHGFHKIVVDQKTGYIVGRPIQITPDNPDDPLQQKFEEDAHEVLGEQFMDKMTTWVKGASNKGEEYLHIYVKPNGEFGYTVISAIECIPIYDSQLGEELQQLIRYYNTTKIQPNGDKQILIKVEWYTQDDVTFYIEDKARRFDTGSEEMRFVLDIDENKYGGNPRPHWIKYKSDVTFDDTGFPTAFEQGSWKKVPFIRLLNNDEALGDLRYYKQLLDAYDFTESELANKIADIADAIWKLVGYEGEDPSEFRKNLKQFKVILLGEDGKADSEVVQIPVEATKALLDRLVDDIFMFAMAVNTHSERLGNAISGVALKFLYTLLDLKSNLLISKAKLALRELLYFVALYLKEISDIFKKKDYDYKTLVFTFDKSIIINEQEKIKNLAISGTIISERTKTEEHPYSKANEPERIEQERAEFQIEDDEENNPPQEEEGNAPQQ